MLRSGPIASETRGVAFRAAKKVIVLSICALENYTGRRTLKDKASRAGIAVRGAFTKTS